MKKRTIVFLAIIAFVLMIDASAYANESENSIIISDSSNHTTLYDNYNVLIEIVSCDYTLGGSDYIKIEYHVKNGSGSIINIKVLNVYVDGASVEYDADEEIHAGKNLSIMTRIRVEDLMAAGVEDFDELSFDCDIRADGNELVSIPIVIKRSAFNSLDKIPIEEASNTNNNTFEQKQDSDTETEQENESQDETSDVIVALTAENQRLQNQIDNMTTDYSYLEDMSVKELKALRNAIDELLGGNPNVNPTQDERNKSNGIEGVFYWGNGFDTTEYIEFTPDNENKTRGSYLDTVSGDIGDYQLASNVVVIDNGKYTKSFHIFDDFLISDTGVLNGIIPEGAVFNVQIGSDNDNYTFKDDGTFIRRFRVLDEMEQLEGIYTREGNMIVCDAFSENFNEYITYYFVIIDNVAHSGFYASTEYTDLEKYRDIANQLKQNNLHVENKAVAENVAEKKGKDPTTFVGKTIDEFIDEFGQPDNSKDSGSLMRKYTFFLPEKIVVKTRKGKDSEVITDIYTQ